MKLPLGQLISFLNAHGWNEAETSDESRVLVFRSQVHRQREITLPTDPKAPDFEDAVSTALEKIALLERRAPALVWTEATRIAPGRPAAFDDFILRIKRSSSEAAGDDVIPLEVARASLVEAETLLMIGSCQAHKPDRYYRRVDNRFSNDLVKRAVFNHTR